MNIAYNFAYNNLNFTSKPKINIQKEVIEKYLILNPQASCKDLAEEFFINTLTMKRILDEYGITLNSKPGRKNNLLTRDEILDFYIRRPELSNKETAKEMGVSYQTFLKYLKLYGLY